MNLALLASVFGASLLGSLHCAGMCGGLVAFAAASPSPARGNVPRRLHMWRPSWLSQLTYHAGRLSSYAALGAAAGGVGSAMNLAGSLAGLSEIAAIVAAVTIVVAAIVSWTGFRVAAADGGVVSRAFPRVLEKMRKLPGHQRGLAIGVATGLLPCGWLYAFVASAAGTGSIVDGALLMGAFWLGTIPALVGVGSFAELLGGKLRSRLPALSAATLLLLASTNLWSRYSNPARLSDVAAANAADTHSERGAASTQHEETPAKPSCH